MSENSTIICGYFYIFSDQYPYMVFLILIKAPVSKKSYIFYNYPN